MNRLLMLCYYFPPLGMGGTQRAAKFAKYLPDFGWQPIVLTVKSVSYWAHDPSLLEELQDINIVRSGSFDPQRLFAIWCRENNKKASSGHAGQTSFINKLASSLFIPDSKILWAFHAVHKAAELMRRYRFQALYTTSPPHSVHLLGLYLAKKYNLSWVADFRDSWRGGVVVHESTRFHRQANAFLQKKTVTNVDAVVAVTPGILGELSQAGKNDFHLIYNGFDPADLPNRTATRDRRKFVLCHCGTVTKFSHPDPLLKAVRLLRGRNPEIMEKLCLQFVGHDALGDLKQLANKYGLMDLVDLKGYLPHRDALQYLVNADGLVLIAQGGEDDHFIPGKTFEYIGAHRPIVAISNVSDTIALLKTIPTIRLCRPDDVNGIADALKSLMENDANRPISRPDNLDRFNRLNQTKVLAEILNKVVGI